MQNLTISEVAQLVGLQPSAIRYYERIKLLPPVRRMSGQRRYDSTAIYQLTVIQRARQLGFTLDEILQLFMGFRSSARASERWRELSRKKLSELDDLVIRIESVRKLLNRMMKNCECDTLERCGQEMFKRGCVDFAANPLPEIRRRRY